jgi:hypothetical protein
MDQALSGAAAPPRLQFLLLPIFDMDAVRNAQPPLDIPSNSSFQWMKCVMRQAGDDIVTIPTEVTLGTATKSYPKWIRASVIVGIVLACIGLLLMIVGALLNLLTAVVLAMAALPISFMVLLFVLRRAQEYDREQRA